jgi:hypothetical protein
MLILMLGFTLFTAFAQLHSQLLRLGEVSLKELAHKLDLADGNKHTTFRDC